ncbi:hypothetical protein [Wohlfahrtiimonas chitiniclastica]|uniref:hypothetical protein n=1 Tax=Wohlfahrtiimonas chitiniclastica TaxID=400946 RepID=UPI001BD008D2|nr:hypothetical protein [Wohlfahrtiimonas chitiniclastica]MBS7819019.1 hypothetical protein [Wohlfahrtiimonas chitiniclastica]
MNTKTMKERLCELAELEDLWDEIRNCTMLDQKNYNIHAIEDISYIAYWTLKEECNCIHVDHPSNGYVSDDNECQLHSSIQNYKEILIILESPHINDYTYTLESAYEISPTLEAINQYKELLFTKLVNLKVIVPNEYYIIKVIDPVPYMASLGRNQRVLENKTITYRVWNAIWENFGYADKFTEKIRSLPSGSIILNACTNYKPEDIKINRPKNSLQMVILSNIFNQTYYAELSHPASMRYNNSIYNFENSIQNIMLI